MPADSLLPGLINAVVAMAPMSTVCQAFSKDKGIVFLPESRWTFHGEPLPCTPFLTEKFPLGQVLRKSLCAIGKGGWSIRYWGPGTPKNKGRGQHCPRPFYSAFSSSSVKRIPPGMFSARQAPP